MGLKQRLKNLLARALAGLIGRRFRDFLCDPLYFEVWEKRGLHITPVHFYQPLPDARELSSYGWDRVSAMPGLDLREKGQLELLDRLSRAYKREYSRFPLSERPSGGFFVDNGTFESVDCEVYYSIIRLYKPSRIVEVGGGNSTLLSASAALANKAETGAAPELTLVEPYPGRAVSAGIPGLSRLLAEKAESVPLETFTALEGNDILFIDSSHVLKTGGDVQRLYLEVLPRLGNGVLVHIHDIFFPFDYPRNVVLGRKRFWTEQYLVQAFLAFNSGFEVLWSSSFMHHKHPGELEAAFPSYSRASRRPGSLWLRRTPRNGRTEA